MYFNYSKISFIVIFASIFLSVSAKKSSFSVDPEDHQLGEIYKEMKKASAGVSMNLDGTFGGGRCNCVCKNNN